MDILVNNAGILRDKSFAKMTLEDFRQVIDVHLMGSAICRQTVPDSGSAQSRNKIMLAMVASR